MQFDFYTPTRIIFGSGKLNSILSVVSEYSDSVLILSGGPNEITNRLVSLLEQGKIKYTVKKVDHEPSIESIRSIVDFSKSLNVGLVIGLGGGSTIDSAKATAALITNPGDITDYLEVVGSNKLLMKPSLPVIAIPTTAGTGSEVTRNAVVSSLERGVKVSLRSPFLYPNVAVIDPELMISLPAQVTAFTGLDALTQLIEPYTCNVPNPLTDALCLDGITRVARSLYKAYDIGTDIQSREDMAVASLFSGIALANAKLGAVHGLAGPIGGVINAPHGAICGSLLPNVMEVNLMTMNDRDPGNLVIQRYDKVSQILGAKINATGKLAIQWIKDFCKHARIPHLSELGLTEVSFDDIIEKAQTSSSMKGNPITLSANDLRNILQMSL